MQRRHPFNLKDSLIMLAEKLNIPIVTAYLARDIIPQEHPYYFGTYEGRAGNPVAMKLVEESDCLVMFGVIISDAIGYALTTGKRPLVLLGDGAFQMTGQEICHCPRYGINPIFIVFNNRRWGTQQHFYPSAGFNELVNWPYSKMAELWGGKGYLCDTCEKLYNVLGDAKDNREFSLLEVLLEKEESTKEFMEWVKELREQAL